MAVKLTLNAKFLAATDTELSYRFSGKLSENGVGLANEIVVLQLKSLSPNPLYPSDWSDFGAVVTDSNGEYGLDWVFYREYVKGFSIAVRALSIRFDLYSSELTLAFNGVPYSFPIGLVVVLFILAVIFVLLVWR